MLHTIALSAALKESLPGVVTSSVPSLNCCGSGQCHGKTNQICRPQRLCSVSNSAQVPTSNPTKVAEISGLKSHILLCCLPGKASQYKSFITETFLPSSFMSVLKSAITLSLSSCLLPPPLSLVTAFFPLLALFLSFLLPRSDQILNYINSEGLLSTVVRVIMPFFFFKLLPNLF